MCYFAQCGAGLYGLVAIQFGIALDITASKIWDLFGGARVLVGV